MWWVYLIAYGIAFGVLSAIVAGRKRRDPSNWFVLGFIFGVFGFIAALVVEDKEDRVESAPAIRETPLRAIRMAVFDPSEMEKQCPDCAEKIKLEARLCRFCGYRFDEEDVRASVARAHWRWLDTVRPTESEHRYCNLCGKPTQENFGSPPLIVCADCVEEQAPVT